MNQGRVIWLTGLAGSGKSTLARGLYKKLLAEYSNLIYLDGDELREIFDHYGYDRKSRIDMAIKRSKLANFLSNQGMIVIVSTISLFKEVYDFNRRTIKNYDEIYVYCSLEELQKRDQKNLYTNALLGKEKNVIGIDIAYDEPRPHLRLENQKIQDVEYNIAIIQEFLKKTRKRVAK